MIESGMKQKIVADRLKIPKSTVSDIWKQFMTRGNTDNKHRSGRTRTLTDRDRRRLEKIVRGNRRKTLYDVTAEINNYRDNVGDPQVSSRTIDRNIKKTRDTIEEW
jgi:transposase